MFLKRLHLLVVLMLTAVLLFAVSMPAFAQTDEPTDEPTNDTSPSLVEMTVGRVLKFGVPEGWVTDPADEDPSDDVVLYIMASDYGAMDGSYASPLQMTGDQQVIALRWSGPEAIVGLGYGGPVTLEAVVQNSLSGLNYGSAEVLSGPETLSIGSWRAQNFKLSLEGGDVTVYVVEVKPGESYLEFFSYAARGELDAVDALTQDVAESMDYPLIVDWLHIRLHRLPLLFSGDS